MTFARVLADAWQRFRRDATTILTIGGALVFWPTWAVLLLVPRPPDLPVDFLDTAAVAAWQQAVIGWGLANAGWYLLAEAVALLGLGALAALFVGVDRPTVGGALGGALHRYGGNLLVSIGTSLAIGIGLRLLILPGLYLQARLAAALPALMASPHRGAGQAIATSWRQSRRGQLALVGALMLLFMVQLVLAAGFLSLDTWIRYPARDNPFVLALVDAGLAAALAGYRVAVLLVGVGVWRRASSGI